MAKELKTTERKGRCIYSNEEYWHNAYFLLDSCNNRLVSGMTGIPDDKITALSYYKDILHDDSPYCARLNHTNTPLCGGWSPIAMNTRQWIQVYSTSHLFIWYLYHVMYTILPSSKPSNERCRISNYNVINHQ